MWQLTWVEDVRPQVFRLRRVMDAAEGVLAAPQNLKPGIAALKSDTRTKAESCRALTAAPRDDNRDMLRRR